MSGLLGMNGLLRVIGCFLAILCFAAPAQAVLDTYMQDFDGLTADTTVNGQDLFSVTSGSTSNAVVQSSTTLTGTGKSLKVTGASTPVRVGRSTDYGGLTPTWVRFIIRPGVGGERLTAPSTGIAAVSFDFSGKVLAANGKAWVDTGTSFTVGNWYEVTYKLNFTSRTYDLYVKSAGIPQADFTPVKTGLGFIDSSKTSLSTLRLDGAYSTTQPDDTFFDNLLIHYIERVDFASAAQTMIQDQVSGPIIVQLQSSLRDPQKAPEDVVLELTTSSPGGKFSLQKDPWVDITQLNLNKDATSAIFYYKDSKAGQPILQVREFPDKGWIDGLQQQKVIAKTAHFEVLATSPQVAGAPFTVTIYARNEEGALQEDYNGTAAVTATYISPATGTKQLDPTTVSGFATGKKEIQMSYPDAGTIQIAVTDTSNASKTGTSGQILFLPSKFQVDLEAQQVVKRAFSLSVSALNAVGAVTPNYEGTVNLTIVPVVPNASGALLSPASIGPAGFSGGKATVEAAYPNWGTINITATAASAPAIMATTGLITFSPESVRVRIQAPPAPRDFFYTHEAFNVEISALAADGATIPNYVGTFELSTTSGFGLPSKYTFVAGDTGTHSFPVSLAEPGTYSVQAKEFGSSLASAQLSATVKQATLVVVSTVGAVGSPTEVTVKLVDEKGKVIESESNATLQVRLLEESANGSISSSALGRPIQIVKGRATFLITDTEAETVGVIPFSELGVKVQPGVVRFGRFAKRGVGFLLWREVKEPKPKE